jgi:hypothetical protein
MTVEGPMKFDGWFEEQHGKRPGGSISDVELRDCIVVGERARAMQSQRAEWDARYESALYAWQVGKTKPLNKESDQ